jgi:ketosteroid isomerase-like protein
MIKRLMLCLATLLLGAEVGHAADSLESAFARHVRAVQARDMRELEATITTAPQLTLILPGGVRTETRQAYLDFHREFFASPTWTIGFDVLEMLETPELGLVATRSHYADTDRDSGQAVRTSSWVTFVFRKEEGEWRLVFDQNTRIPQGE